MTSSTSELVFGVGMYMACSSFALVSNKVAISLLPTPGVVFCIQFVVAIAFIYVGKAFGRLDADTITWPNVRLFLPFVASFAIAVYACGRALVHSNVETLIVFRSCSPLIVSVLDWVFLGRELPSLRSTLALGGVIAGAIGYVWADNEFAARGFAAYFWSVVNLAGIVFDMTYGKRLMSRVSFKAPVWSSALYTNVLAFWPLLFMTLGSGEPERFLKTEFTIRGMAWLLITSIVGIALSWSGWNARSLVSATAYTLLGVVCKFGTVLLTMALCEKHATPMGLAMLSLCLLSSSAYQQAPERASHASATTVGDHLVAGRADHDIRDGPDRCKDLEVPDGPDFHHRPKEVVISSGPCVPDEPEEVEMTELLSGI